jgi:hypothetical protein
VINKRCWRLRTPSSSTAVGLPRHTARGTRQFGPGQEPGGLDHHDAGGAQRVPVSRKKLHPKNLRGAAHLQAGAPADQGTNP